MELDPQLLDSEILVGDPTEEIVEVETTAITSYIGNSLFMKVNSNYMLNKGSRAAIYSDGNGVVWGSPYKINGVVYVPAKPITTVYLGGEYGWADAVAWAPLFRGSSCQEHRLRRQDKDVHRSASLWRRAKRLRCGYTN